MTKKGVKQSLKAFKQIGKGPSEVEQNQLRRVIAERDLLLSAIAPADYAKIEAQMKAVSESPDKPMGEPKKELTPQDFLPDRKDCNCSCHEENGGSVKHITACCKGGFEDIRLEANTQGGPKVVRIGGVHTEKWQGALLRMRHNRLPPDLHIVVNGLAGTLHRTGQQPSSFIYHPTEKIVRLDMVSDPELERAARQWLGDIPMDAA